MTRVRAEELASPEALFADGFDDAIVGVSRRFSDLRLVVYSLRAVIASLESQGMTVSEAYEFFDFNLCGSYVGEGTPIFLMDDE